MKRLPIPKHVLVELAAEGLCMADVSRTLGCTDERARYWIKAYGVVFRSGYDGSWRRKVTYAQYVDAAARGLTRKEAAKELGISLSGVDSARRRLGLMFKPAKHAKRAFVHRLTDAERLDYRTLRANGYTIPEALRSIKRADLISEALA